MIQDESFLEEFQWLKQNFDKIFDLMLTDLYLVYGFENFYLKLKFSESIFSQYRDVLFEYHQAVVRFC